MPKKIRDYRKEYDSYHKKPEQRRKNDKRKQARRNVIKIKGKAAVKGKDVDHKDRNANNNAPSNLRIRSRKANRGDNK